MIHLPLRFWLFIAFGMAIYIAAMELTERAFPKEPLVAQGIEFVMTMIFLIAILIHESIINSKK